MGHYAEQQDLLLKNKDDIWLTENGLDEVY